MAPSVYQTRKSSSSLPGIFNFQKKNQATNKSEAFLGQMVLIPLPITG
jgi:hypothetical protein